MIWSEKGENVYSQITPAIRALEEQWEKKNYIDPELYRTYSVRRGLRDENGQGVLTGLTRVAEIDRAGMNICFAQDSIRDPWYPVGNGNILRILDAGLHICHMMGYDDLKRSLDFVTDNGA